MSNEIIGLCGMPAEERGAGYVLACATQQVYQVGENGFNHIFEISAPSYTGRNKDDHNKLIAFGEYTGTTGAHYIVKIASPTTYVFSDDGGGTFSDPFVIKYGPRLLSNAILISFKVADGNHTTDDQWDIYVDRCWQMDDGQFNKTAMCTYQHGIWFTNRLNKLKFVQGRTVLNVYQSCTDGVPSGVYLEEFYGHLLVGRPTYRGAEHKDWILGCHLHDPSIWTPNKINEASYYEFDIDVVTGEKADGLTGMKKLRDWVIVYTPSKIWYIEYVGLEGKGLVYQRKPLIEGVGSAFKYGVIGNDLYHFFWSDENCYEIDGTHQRTMLAMPKTIGDDIKEFFFQDLNPNPTFRNKMWAYIERYFNEVHWVYVSKASTGDFDKELVYNFKEGTWTVKTTDANICSHCEVSLPSSLTTIGDITTEIENISDLIGQIEDPSGFSKKVFYGASDLKVLRDEQSTDVLEDLLPIQNGLFLESQDEIYTTLNDQKHVDGMVIHGGYDADTCEGIRVLVSGRFSVSEPVRWQIAGVWQQTTEYGLFSFPRVSGRVFRYRFEPVPRKGQPSTRLIQFNAWGEYVFGVKKDVEK